LTPFLHSGNVEAQICSLVEAWEWDERDRVLHLLPLHHLHGIVNILYCGLWSGACVQVRPRVLAPPCLSASLQAHGHHVFAVCGGVVAQMLEKFDADAVWQAWRDGADGTGPPHSLFMSVPIGLGRIFALYHRSANLYQIHK
jgi:hypothetical protein